MRTDEQHKRNLGSTNAQAWVQLYLNSDAAKRPPLIDIRPITDFVKCHIQCASHFPALLHPDGLAECMSELPPPHARKNTAVLASTIQQAIAAATLLDAKGYQNVTPLTFSLVEDTLPIETGSASRPLWQPAPLVSETLSLILEHVPKRTALDIGAGAGRDSAFLASNGFDVIAVDRDRALVTKATALASRYVKNQQTKSSRSGSVTGIVRTFGANIADDTHFLRCNASGLLVVVRFLRHGVLDLLWHAVLPGGFVVYEHFLQGCEHFGGPVKTSQMLKPGELSQVFSLARGFTEWQHVNSNLPDGRPIVRFIARRTLDSLT